ncbi:MAG: flagellar motor protein MotB [Eubacteriales bacterium]|nr:flagellar motor protein MotB [Eubacteriales bacterium]
MRHRKTSKVNKDAWLATYADMITLILVFFVLLYAMSSIDQEKYKMLVQAFSTDPDTLEQLTQTEEGKEGGADDGLAGENIALDEIKDLDDLYKYLSQYVEENGLSDSVEVAKGKNMVYVRFTSNLFFQPDRAVLKEGGVEILDQVGPALAKVEVYVQMIRIDGHTAESPPGPGGVSDRDLSTERANAVLKYLETYHIKDPSKLYAVGYGRYRPVAPNDTEANRAKNRRVEILISKTDIVQQEIDAAEQSKQNVEE